MELLRYIPYALGGGYVLGRALVDFIATNSHQVIRGSIYCITRYIICSTYILLLILKSSIPCSNCLHSSATTLQQWGRKCWRLACGHYSHEMARPKVLRTGIILQIRPEWVELLGISRSHGWLCRFDTEWKSRGCSNKFLVTHKQVDKLEKKSSNLPNAFFHACRPPRTWKSSGKGLWGQTQSAMARRPRYELNLFSVHFNKENRFLWNVKMHLHNWFLPYCVQVMLSYKYDWTKPPSECCVRNDHNVP